MQFTGHPLSVHHFVTALWNFNLVPYCQSSCILQLVPSVVVSIMIDISLTRCENMIFVFEIAHDTAEATKNICGAKNQGAVDPATITRWLKIFSHGVKT